MPETEPPLVDVKVTNPVTYLKNWWRKVIGNEGIEFRLHIKPLTAIAMSVIIASIGFGVGRFVIPPGIKIPFFKYEVVGTPTPSPETWKETAFTGTLQFSSTTQKFYLMTTSSSELITLQVPNNIDLTDFVGKRILAIGKYNKSTKALVVADAKSLEVLPKNPVSIPTTAPSPTPEPTLTPSPEASLSGSPT